jgi:hypothetical protein
MSHATTRAIENLTKAFKTFTRPTVEMADHLVIDMIREFPITVVEEGPKKKAGKFCKRHWILSFPWKVEDKRDEPCEFPTVEEANAAAEAYSIQNAAAIKCRTSLLMDQLRAEALRGLWDAYERKQIKQGEAIARVSRIDACKDLSRM